MLDGLDREVNVEERPVKVPRTGKLDCQDLLDGCLPEPREVLERQEQLLAAKKQPEASARDVGNFSL
jgi:hypothetical protein